MLKTETGHRIGYGRVSSSGQNLDSQMDALQAAGCSKIFSDKLTGKTIERPEWNKLLDYVRPGDILVITELSRMTRSLKHLLDIIQVLSEKKVELISLRENIDTTTATGRAFVHIMGAINQMELELKAERVEAGRDAAKLRGGTGGRPKADMNKINQALVLYSNTNQAVDDICDTFSIKKRTFYKYLSVKRDETDLCQLRREKGFQRQASL